jgi:hypothetical protein
MVYGTQAEHMVSGDASAQDVSEPGYPDERNRAKCHEHCELARAVCAVGGDGAERRGSRSDPIGVGDSGRACDHFGDALVDHAPVKVERFKARAEIDSEHFGVSGEFL